MKTDSSAVPPIEASSGSDTKERLLDSAERLFAELGFQGTSMRAVTHDAAAALSAANYHFGSKEELLGAVIRRRVQPINEKRLKRLEELELGSTPPDVETVVEVFLRPLFEARAERMAQRGSVDFQQVAARLYADPKHLMDALRKELFAEVNDRFVAALQRALPGASAGGVEMAMQLTVGMMVHVISGRFVDAVQDLHRTSGDYEPVLARMIAYASAGIRAAAVAGSPGPEALTERGEGGAR